MHSISHCPALAGPHSSPPARLSRARRLIRFVSTRLPGSADPTDRPADRVLAASTVFRRHGSITFFFIACTLTDSLPERETLTCRGALERLISHCDAQARCSRLSVSALYLRLSLLHATFSRPNPLKPPYLDDLSSARLETPASWPTRLLLLLLLLHLSRLIAETRESSARCE